MVEYLTYYLKKFSSRPSIIRSTDKSGGRSRSRCLADISGFSSVPRRCSFYPFSLFHTPGIGVGWFTVGGLGRVVCLGTPINREISRCERPKGGLSTRFRQRQTYKTSGKSRKSFSKELCIGEKENNFYDKVRTLLRAPDVIPQ